MVGQKGKKKARTAEAVGRAMAPVQASTAVPRSSTSPPAMSAPSTSGAGAKPRGAASPPRILGHPESPRDEFSEPESSLFDYQQMDEAGYMTVGFGTWPANHRHRRDGEDNLPRFRQAGSVGIYAEPGDIEGFHGLGQGQGDSPEIKHISDIYATPVKKKGKGKSSSARSGTASMTATQQDVRTEMKRIHDLPSEVSETMSRSSRHNAPGSNLAPDSGRGSTRPDSLVEDEEGGSHDLAQVSDHMTQGRHVGGVMAALEAQPGDPVDENEALEGLIKASRADTGRLQAQQSSGRSSRSRTPRSGQGFVSDMEAFQLKMQNEEMVGELHTLRKVAESIRDGDMESARTVYIQKQLEDLKDENETLKTTVHRLNVELSDYQAKFRPVDPTQLKQAREVSGLPSKGPIPSWLISKRYLAPLFLAYDDHLEEKDRVIEECKNELLSIKKRTEEILKENQRLRMSGGMDLGGQGDTTEWHQLQEQARLVLEENQVLMEQLEIQTNKSKDMYTAHMTEISRMAKKLSLSEGERADTERELDTVRVRFRELKHKHDQIVMESGSSVNVHSHINTIADLKRSVTEEKEQVEREIDSIRIKLKASEEERKSQALQMIDLTAENKRLKAEVKAMQKSVRHAQQKMAVLHRAIELSEDKEMVTQEQLANVIKVAEKTALERDTVYKVAREQQEEAKLTVNKMLHGSAAVGKLEEKLKIYRLKASAKLNTVAERLKDQDEAFNSQKKEYEREIQYLRLLLKEKEEIIESLERDKKDIEKDLDTMWQAATSENNRVKNILRSGTRKLKDQVHITDALKEEMENEELLHFSDDDSRE